MRKSGVEVGEAKQVYASLWHRPCLLGALRIRQGNALKGLLSCLVCAPFSRAGPRTVHRAVHQLRFIYIAAALDWVRRWLWLHPAAGKGDG